MSDCCCDCPLDLGCVDNCNCLDTLQLATKAGRYTLKYRFNGATKVIDTEKLAVGEKIEFDISGLVAEYVYSATLEDPFCDAIELKDAAGIKYDCLKFKPNLILNYAI